MKIAALPKQSRPREKALASGLSNLDDAELLALLIGKGTKGYSALELAYSLLKDHGGLKGLEFAEPNLFSSRPGIGKVRSLELSAVFEIHRRLNNPEQSKERWTLSKENVFHRFVSESFGQEKAYVILLSKKNEVNGIRLLYLGTRKEILLSAKEILGVVLSSGAERFALVHSHSTSSPEPSVSDVEATIVLREQGFLLSLELVDHFIVASSGVYSCAENGLLEDLSKEKE